MKLRKGKREPSGPGAGLGPKTEPRGNMNGASAVCSALVAAVSRKDRTCPWGVHIVVGTPGK